MNTFKAITAMLFLSLSSCIFADQHKDIYVVNHGWHTAIVLKLEDINSTILQIDPFFKKYQYIEVGWGDEDFYKNSDPSVYMALKAVLIPTPSVLHVRGINRHELSMFFKENIVKITISQGAFTKLSLFIENSFSKKESKSVILSQGLYPDSFFYLSDKKYHILQTCNVWTAKALESAEVNISPFFTITPDAIFSQIRELEKR